MNCLWECRRERTGRPIVQPNHKSETQREIGITRGSRGNPYFSEVPEWLQELKENHVDERVTEHRESHASSSHELSLEPQRWVVAGNHSVYTHFPKDRNCEICQRTKMTRAPCRRRTGEVVPRAENFGVLITADHQIHGEGCESTNDHRLAVVVQDSATQWIQSYSCKPKTSQLAKILGADQETKSHFTLTNPWNLPRPVKIIRGIIVRQPRTVQKRMGLLNEQYAE